MSSYRGRTGPNFSEYLNSLNSLTSPFEQEQFQTEELDLSQDLAMFTNTDFTHFDIPSLPEDGTYNFEMNDPKNNHNIKYEDLLTAPDAVPSYASHNIETSAPESSAFYSTYNTPIQPAPAAGFGSIENRGSPSTSTTHGNSTRSKADHMVTSPLNTDDNSRVAAEEDKRRRNIAASARFRVKKKQREQALETTVREVQDKNNKLESRISQLEMENKWLKDLITEKNGISSKEEMAAAYHQYRKESEERDLKITEHTTGVGTSD